MRKPAVISDAVDRIASHVVVCRKAQIALRNPGLQLAAHGLPRCTEEQPEQSSGYMLPNIDVVRGVLLLKAIDFILDTRSQ